MDLALFDFDGTITKKETMPEFMKIAVRPVRLAVGKLIFLPLVLGYKTGLISGNLIRAAICKYGFWRVQESELEAHGAAFAHTFLPSVVRSEAMERIAWHKSRGDRVVVVSGGLDLYLNHWTRAHGLDLLCSTLERNAGRFTGNYFGAQCVRGEKARRVLAAYSLSNFRKVFAYGDTPEDFELLALAHEPYYCWKPWASGH